VISGTAQSVAVFSALPSLPFLFSSRIFLDCFITASIHLELGPQQLEHQARRQHSERQRHCHSIEMSSERHVSSCGASPPQRTNRLTGGNCAALCVAVSNYVAAVEYFCPVQCACLLASHPRSSRRLYSPTNPGRSLHPILITPSRAPQPITTPSPSCLA
jgi:hypothetical protein